MLAAHNFSKRTRLLYVDIGRTGWFSRPRAARRGAINATQDRGAAYVGAINATQDVVLVDGRWRVACALSAFPFVADAGRLMVHDFHRRQYHSLLKFYAMETERDRLAVLKKRPNVSRAELGAHLRRFMRDAD
jgi:hypothetical protein